MAKFRSVLQMLGLLVMSLAFTSLAHAQAPRTWVSGVGGLAGLSRQMEARTQI